MFDAYGYMDIMVEGTGRDVWPRIPGQSHNITNHYPKPIHFMEQLDILVTMYEM